MERPRFSSKEVDTDGSEGSVINLIQRRFEIQIFPEVIRKRKKKNVDDDFSFEKQFPLNHLIAVIIFIWYQLIMYERGVMSALLVRK